MPKVKPITLDGSTLEGGGQLVRVALSVSAITGTPVHIHNIRANRAKHGRYKSQAKDSAIRSSRDQTRQKKQGSSSNEKVEGGLKESHLAAVVWLGQQVGAFIEGGEVGSRELTFIPAVANTSTDLQDVQRLAGQSTIKLGNPGSVFLILQAIYPYIVFGSLQSNSEQVRPASEVAGEVCLTLHGGTNVPKSMSAEYVTQVFAPVLSRLGFPAPEIEVIRRGWAGSAPRVGEVKVTVPRRSQADTLPTRFCVDSRGEITKVTVSVIAYPNTTQDELISILSKNITETFADLVQTEPEIEVVLNEDSGDERRLYILLVAHTSNGWIIGRDFLGSGRRAKNIVEARKIIEEACMAIVKELAMEIRRGGCVDEYMSDQLGIFQALTAHFADRPGVLQRECGTSVVDSGDWRTGGKDKAAEGQHSGDNLGSLHARTVRWVCETMMKGVRFAPGGACSRAAPSDEPFDIRNLTLEDEDD